MNGRRDRILIPSAIALIAIGGTLWLASGGTMGPTNWFGFSGETPKFLVGAGIVTVGIGYLCNALFTLVMLMNETCRLVDFSKLISAFGLTITKGNLKPEERTRLEEELLDEFHLRLHSHAPQTLIDYCSRRNTAWYIAITSGIASIIGWSIAVCILFADLWCVCTDSPMSCGGAIASFAVFAIVIPWALFCQGAKWNREFWGVCWKWIEWDRISHVLPHEWVKRLPPGVQWISEFQSDG